MIEKFKIRASEIGDISGYLGKEVKELPKGAQTYCKKWLLSKTHNEPLPFANKYTQKGIRAEDESIKLIQKVLGYDFLLKEDSYASNEWVHGHCDVLQPDEVIEIKNSYLAETFPFYEVECPNNGYFLQSQGYMDIYERESCKLIYTLINATEKEIENETLKYCRAIDSEYTEEIENLFRQRMTYDHLKDEHRIKVFEFKRDDNVINQIHDRVEMCRTYINSIL